MSQPYDPNEGQYRPGAPRPKGSEDLAAGQPPARDEVRASRQPGGAPSPGAPGPRPQENWDEEPTAQRQPLGSLSQAAREKQLNQARWLLIIIGGLTLAVNAFFAIAARSQVEAEIRRLQQQAGPGMQFVINQAEVERAVQLTVIAGIVGSILGAVFIFFGIIVKMYPVPITITSLVLYVVGNLIFAAVNPEAIAQGLIIKIVIVIALISSIRAAIAYEKELALEREGAWQSP